ncbi:MAG: diphosphomevalonate decarboxylase, partial [Chloroflexi bacterium]|nr:diphosphomevalonate decarboxylase [Chloroflexota bacterium]
ELDGVPASSASAARISHHLDLIRSLGSTESRARVVSRNNFPMGAGIASSASGFAALTCAAAWALGLDLSERDLSRLARRGSGSAARSVPGGFVEWRASERDEDSFAQTIAPAEHWQLHDLVAIVGHGEKSVGSTEGHALAHSTPLNAARVAQVQRDLPVMRRAILEKDFHALGDLAERDTLMMHAVMMTSSPSLLYWTPETLAVMRAVREWRAAGLACYFSIDAGPNVHVITVPDAASETEIQLRALPEVHDLIRCKVGAGAHRSGEHLF